MKEKLPLLDQKIIDCLNNSYGIKALSLTFLPIGADNNASVYQANTQEASYFIKLKRGHHHELSITIARLLYNAGIPQIIAPINTIQNNPTQIIDDFTLIVYPFIEGKDGFNQNLNDEQWFLLGKALRQVHEINIPQSIQNQIRQEKYSSQWREAVKSVINNIEGISNNDESAIKLLKFIKENIKTIQCIVDRAEELSKIVQKQASEFVLCHSDIHGGNVLLDNKNNLYIVDWDEPILAPKERDLMFIGAGVANVWNKPHEERLFYQGYGETEINKNLIAYYRHERIIEDIAIYSQDLLLCAAGGQNRLVMYQQFLDMFEPNGVVDIALKSE